MKVSRRNALRAIALYFKMTCGIVFAFHFFMNVKIVSPGLLIATLVGCFYSCNQKMTPFETSEVSLPDNGSNVIIAQNHFAFNLFHETLSHENNNTNKLISPLSVYLDLSMAYNGAGGDTRDAMNHTLGLNNINTDVLNKTNHALITGLPHTDSAVTIDIANAIWYRKKGVAPIPAFLKVNSDYYQSQVKGADFSPSTVNEINQWVANVTNQKIKSIIQSIDPSDLMYLVNAVYFKGSWKTPFNPITTQNRIFTTASGNKTEVPFMNQNTRFNYMQNDSVQMVELPYGNGTFSMYVLLPSKNLSLNDFADQLNEKSLAGYVSKMDSVKVNLWLPKWKYSYATGNLKPELTALGMGNAFSKKADFSDMYPSGTPVNISKVLHKAYIEVNEKGTEAAAATSIGVSVTSMPINPPPVMIVDRPFLYLIVERNSGAILFLGQLNNPSAE